MKYYEQMVDKKLLTFKEICDIVGNKSTAKVVIDKYIENGYLDRIKQNLYVVISLETKEPIADKFMIGTKIAKDAAIYGISALEYYGYYNQVRNDVFVITKTKFRTFYYNKIFYRRANSNFNSGINKKNSFLSLTDLERSLVDSINDLDRLVSLEELNNIISLLPSLDEQKIKKYLELHNIQFLYQKTGYILEMHKQDLNLSDDLFVYLKNTIKTKRYLLKNNTNVVYDFNWKLMVPIKESAGEHAIY